MREPDGSVSDADAGCVVEPENRPECGVPVVPTSRCKRCGAWLCSRNSDSEHCEPCHDTMMRNYRPCADCGEPFFHDDHTVVRCPSCQAVFEKRKKTCLICGAGFVPFTCGLCNGPKTKSLVCHSCHWREVHATAAAAQERICKVCGCSFLPRVCDVAGCGVHLSDTCSVCHEQIAHNDRWAEVWRLDDCPRCEDAVRALKRNHRKVVCHDLQKLIKGDQPDIDAMTQLAMNGGEAPLVRLDGRFLESREIENLISA